jgi:hypothetical protein
MTNPETIETIDALKTLSESDIISLKRTFNTLSRKKVFEEIGILSEEDTAMILEYTNQNELWSMYKMSHSPYHSFREMILGF